MKSEKEMKRKVTSKEKLFTGILTQPKNNQPINDTEREYEYMCYIFYYSYFFSYKCGLFNTEKSLGRTGRVVQSVARLTQMSEVLGSIPVQPQTYVSPSADSKRAVHLVLANRLGDLSLPRNIVVRLSG